MWPFDWHIRIWPCPIPKFNVKVMHIGTEFLANGDSWHKHCCYQQIESSLQSLCRHIYSLSWPILKVKVKVMHILTVNISQMVKDMANIPKYYVACWLDYFELTSTYSNLAVGKVSRQIFGRLVICYISFDLLCLFVSPFPLIFPTQSGCCHVMDTSGADNRLP